MKRKKDKRIKCFVYLSVDADKAITDFKEQIQLKYIREYARAHNITITKIYHRGIRMQSSTNKIWGKMIQNIYLGEEEGILIANMAAVARDLSDAYSKIGGVCSAGGVVITVDEGRLCLPIKMIGGIEQ